MQVARENVPNLQIKKWPGTTHSLPMEVPQRLDRELLDFMADPEPDIHPSTDAGSRG